MRAIKLWKHVVGWAVFFGLGLLAAGVFAVHTGGGDVRIVAQRQADNAVRVALQVREAGGSWSVRHLPEARVVPANATVGQWLASSELNVGAGKFLNGALVCMVDHVPPGNDQF